MLVQAVDVEHYTPRMVEVGGADRARHRRSGRALPAGRAGPQPARTIRSGSLADGMCAALEGEAARASALIDQARNQARHRHRPAARREGGRRRRRRRAAPSTFEWDGVNDDHRLALRPRQRHRRRDSRPADRARAGPHIQAWLARAPMVPLEQRLSRPPRPRRRSASSPPARWSRLHSLMLDQTDPAEFGRHGRRRGCAPPGSDARSADRMEALRSLWSGDEAPARALCAADPHRRRRRADPGLGRAAPSDADNLIAAMLSAGMDRQAARWGAGGRAGRQLRPRLGAARGRRAAGRGRHRHRPDRRLRRRRRQPGRRALAACWSPALAGLGRISADQAAQAGLPARRRRPLDRRRSTRPRASAGAGHGRPARRHRHADRRLAGVPPQYLFRIVRALRAVGLEYRGADDRRRGGGAAVTEALARTGS